MERNRELDGAQRWQDDSASTPRRPHFPIALVTLTCSIVVSWGLLQTAGAWAQPMAVGAEIQVNTYTTATQSRPEVTLDPQGRFAVVWDSFGSHGNDTSQESIQMRIFDSAGRPLTDQFQVNSYTTGSQTGPDLTIDPFGRFLVVWSSEGSGGTDQASSSVQGRFVSSTGIPVANDFQLNTEVSGSQGGFFGGPSIGTAAAGNSVVVWGSDDLPESSIQGQIFDAFGDMAGAEFQVNSITTNGYQEQPAVAVAANGSFVVAWRSGFYILPLTGSNYLHIRSRRFGPTGAPLGPDFDATTNDAHEQVWPDVAFDPLGRFVVVWQTGQVFGAPDGTPSSIEGRRFDPSGVPLGDDFPVNTYTTGSQVTPAVGFDDDGRFTVVWASNASANGTGGVFARRFEADGSSSGSDLQVNTDTNGFQGIPAIASKSGRSVVVWQGTEIRAQRFCGLFCDGFESGDTCAWSSSVPLGACSRL